jgi:hypothetical protein
MSDKPSTDQAPVFALSGWSALRLEGTDAARFAQAQFMGDVDALAPGQWQWNGWLTPKGRVIALFALLRQDAQTLRLLLPDAEPAALATALSRYVFRSKLRIVPEPELAVSGRFGAPRHAAGAAFAGQDPASGLELDLGGDGGARTLLIGPEAAPQAPDLDSRWRGFDLAHGLPRLAADQAEQWTPQQLSLGRLRAYSVKKGCYPGQEIVARTHFLGQAKRGLARLEAGAPMPAGQVVASQAPDRPLGTIVSREGRQALAVLPLELDEDANLLAGEVPCHRMPLLDGLAR